jgi:hypothetical protein
VPQAPETPDTAIEVEPLQPRGGSFGIDTQGLQAVLDRRAAAVQAGDQKAFLADLEPSNRKLIRRQRMVFSNLRQFDFRDFRLSAAEIMFGIPPGADSDVYEYAPVLQIAQLTADEARAGVVPAEAFEYKLAERDGRTVVTDITPITPRSAKKHSVEPDLYANAPWNMTALTVVNAGNVWLAADDSVRDLERYAAAAEQQAGEVEALWGDRPRFPGHVLFLTRDRSTLRRWFGIGNDRTSFEGRQIPLRGVDSNGDVYRDEFAGSRIVVNVAAIEQFGDDPELVLRHELAHAVTARETNVSRDGVRVFAARWAIEGFATWMGYMGRPDRRDTLRAVVADGVRAGRFDGTPPGSRNFYDEDRVHFNYALSMTIFDFVEQRHDRDTAIEFYARAIGLNDALTPLAELRTFDRMCRRVLGTGGDAFLDAWSGFVRRGA